MSKPEEKKSEKPFHLRARDFFEKKLLEIVLGFMGIFVYQAWDFGKSIALLPAQTAAISHALNDTVKLKESLQRLDVKADSISILTNEVKELKFSNEALMIEVTSNYSDITFLYTEIEKLKNQ
jgi:FtsZ-binding cell division protein ZapB